ncbi:MAG: hypothetical protein A3I16_13595 [Burkholderiales bacterium RIFCSPLOWO2_02_FULL_66_35]|nr:MAG: hypothetical protein A3I16_13595 [Burkholderiales bacterium RIFCSPLOWO2_02_FULL_66_35]
MTVLDAHWVCDSVAAICEAFEGAMQGMQRVDRIVLLLEAAITLCLVRRLSLKMCSIRSIQVSLIYPHLVLVVSLRQLLHFLCSVQQLTVF